MNLTLRPAFATCTGGVQEQKSAARSAVERSALLSTLPMETRDAWRKDDNDAPRPSLGTHWSLSHSAGRVAGLAARHRVGIDIEQHRLPLERSFERISRDWINEAELEMLGLEHRDEFTELLWTRVWTAKESALKAVGLGLLGLSRMTLDSLNATEGRLSFDNRTLQISLRELNGFTVAVASKEVHTVDWHGLTTLAPIAS